MHEADYPSRYFWVDSNGKKEILDREYANLQRFLKGNKDVPLYSANKQQALRYYRKVKQKEYPLTLRNDLINLRKAKAFWFLKFLFMVLEVEKSQ